MSVLSILSSISLFMWLYLALFHGNFWNPPVIKIKKKKISLQPEITVVVPARNEERYISRALTSLLNQSYKGEYRVVASDDCALW